MQIVDGKFLGFKIDSIIKWKKDFIMINLLVSLTQISLQSIPCVAITHGYDISCIGFQVE